MLRISTDAPDCIGVSTDNPMEVGPGSKMKQQTKFENCELFSFIHDANAHFASHLVLPRDQLSLHCHYVQVLEEAKSKVVVHLVKGSDHRMGKVFLKKFAARHPPESRDTPTTKTSKIGRTDAFHR